MPTITINGVRSDFAPGETILQVANRLKESGQGQEIPQYCYHPGLSIVASCRICLVEIWAPNPRSGALEPFLGGKLVPSCQQTCADGMVVYSDSPKAVQNQKAVMEYLLINHPLDCPVCDQAGECFLQDYSYLYGRGVSRFEEDKVKQPKKDLGPHVYLYSDRCIMCTRCVRFTREVSGTGELLVQGRGNREEIDVFPGIAIDNELSANVIDLCPVGALLDKDFLFAQRVWFLKETPSVDGLTASGDNISVHHNEGAVYRFKPRRNMRTNKWWITDEVRYSWKHVHSDARLASPMRRQFGTLMECDFIAAYEAALEGLVGAVSRGGRLALMVSPMLSCEEAFLLAQLALAIDPKAILGVGPVPVRGQDKVYPPNATPDDARAFVVLAEKAPNARGVRRVLEALSAASGPVLAYEQFVQRVRASDVGAVLLTGNYPLLDGQPWGGDDLVSAIGGGGSGGAGGANKFRVLIDTLASRLAENVDVLLPGATWLEKSGTFENWRNLLQAFEQAIPTVGVARAEGQIAIELLRELARAAARLGLTPAPFSTTTLHAGEFVSRTQGYPGAGSVPGVANDADDSRVLASAPGGQMWQDQVQVLRTLYNAADVRALMARTIPALGVFATDVLLPEVESQQQPDMAVVEL